MSSTIIMVLRNHTFKVSCAAGFASLAAILTILPLSFPFPIITYLKFDLAEIPVVIAFLMLGTWPGMVSAITLWILLNFFGSWTPIGPAMKFTAIISTLIGLWIGSGFKNAPIEGFKTWSRGILMIILGAIARIIVMSLFNYIIIWIMFPFFLDIAAKTITLTVGLTFKSSFDALIWILIFTAVFNALHTLLSVLPSLTIVKALLKHLKYEVSLS
ncbi:MAG: hypothetical protein QXP91_06050 [Candidatus Methanomethylicia archaeon]